MTCWRINPDAALDHAVHRLALQESRSTSNMLTVLIREAISARRAESSTNALANVIRGGEQR